MSTKKTPLIENGIVVGTGSDKYETKNPLAQYMLKTFDRTVGELAGSIRPKSILEIGCGEGHITEVLLQHTEASIRATDLSQTIVDLAQQRIQSPRVSFEAQNIYTQTDQTPPADLVVCCEVLEHLEDPRQGLKKLAQLAHPYALISVPREPLWRILNFIRGAHVKNFGNSPGHIQHWSQRAFLKFTATEFEFLQVRAPIPWTIVLGRSRLSL